MFLVFAGWLADVYFGRYKVMKVSIWVMWWGSVCTDMTLTSFSECSYQFLCLSTYDKMLLLSVNCGKTHSS